MVDEFDGRGASLEGDFPESGPTGPVELPPAELGNLPEIAQVPHAGGPVQSCSRVVPCRRTNMHEPIGSSTVSAFHLKRRYFGEDSVLSGTEKGGHCLQPCLVRRADARRGVAVPAGPGGGAAHAARLRAEAAGAFLGARACSDTLMLLQHARNGSGWVLAPFSSCRS